MVIHTTKHMFLEICIKLSEANRPKNINEKKKYGDALFNLKIKCIWSNFSRKLINNTFNELDKKFIKDTKSNN